MHDKQTSINSDNSDALLKFLVTVARAARVCEPHVFRTKLNCRFSFARQHTFKVLNSVSVVLRFFYNIRFIEYCKFGTFREGLFLPNFLEKLQEMTKSLCHLLI